MEKIKIDVDKYDITDNQTVLVKIPVGPWGMLEVQQYCQTVMETFKEEFKRNNLNVNLFVFPVNPVGISPSLEVLEKPKEGETVVMHVPVSGMQTSEIPQYLKTIKEATLADWDDKYPGVHLEIFGILDNGRTVELKIKK